MRSIRDQQLIAAAVDRVFAALIQPDDICHWWEASTAIVFPESNGLWVASWGESNDPDYMTAARLSVFDPPNRLTMTDYKYRSKSGPMPFEADFSVEFEVTPAESGSMLSVQQTGFPDDSAVDDFFAGCVSGWRQTLQNFADYFDKLAQA